MAASWNSNLFKGFDTNKHWPNDPYHRSADSNSSWCKTIDESLQRTSHQNPFLTRIRSFRAWTIKLNCKDELVVEGTLECGTRARSKPIAGRVTATKILSKMKHVYRLIGDITDPNNELPGFVLNRFNTGFPEDWEIVVAIWKGYASSSGSLNLTLKSFPMPENFVAEKKLRLDTAMEYESQDDRMSRTMSDVKQLSRWTPFITSNGAGESYLAFRGTLLSVMGYSVNKNHETDIICRRLSARIIETVKGQFYELIGDLNNTKHSVPKELVMLCRNGCPKEIYLFCEKWRSLKGDEMEFNGSIPNCKQIHRTRQNRSISLVRCDEESASSFINFGSNSISPERSIGETAKRKRSLIGLSENCMTGDTNVDNNTNGDKKLRVRKQHKIIRKMPTNSSETSSGEREDIAKGQTSKIFEVRPIIRKETTMCRSSSLKPMPSISFVYHKISPPTESVLSDGV